MSKFGGLAVDVASTSRMEIILPGEIDPVTDEAGKVGYIEFLPWDSDPGRLFDREQNKEAVCKGFRQPSRAVLRDEAEKADVVLEQAKRLSVLAVGWHLVGPDRKVIDVPFSTDNAPELFSDAKTAWLRRQSWVYVGNEANFMKRSSQTSTSSPSAGSETRGG
jgi:hypothetical protein